MAQAEAEAERATRQLRMPMKATKPPSKMTPTKILQASTSEVYGDPSVHRQTEDYWCHVNPIGPRSCYDEGKKCSSCTARN